jgi:hypothetical protein
VALLLYVRANGSGCGPCNSKSVCVLKTVPLATSTGWPSAMQCLLPVKSLTFCATFCRRGLFEFLMARATPFSAASLPFFRPCAAAALAAFQAMTPSNWLRLMPVSTLLNPSTEALGTMGISLHELPPMGIASAIGESHALTVGEAMVACPLATGRGMHCARNPRKACGLPNIGKKRPMVMSLPPCPPPPGGCPRKPCTKPFLRTGLVLPAARPESCPRASSSRAMKGACTTAMMALLRMAPKVIGGHGHGSGGMWNPMATAPEPAAGMKFTSTVGCTLSRMGPANGAGKSGSGGRGPAGGGMGAGSVV